MQLPTTRRPVRIRRLLTVSAIAAVVVLAPTTGADGLVLPVSNAAESTARPAADDRDDAKWSAPEVHVGVIRWWPTPCSG
jgi:hypothetical protein